MSRLVTLVVCLATYTSFALASLQLGIQQQGLGTLSPGAGGMTLQEAMAEIAQQNGVSPEEINQLTPESYQQLQTLAQKLLQRQQQPQPQPTIKQQSVAPQSQIGKPLGTSPGLSSDNQNSLQIQDYERNQPYKLDNRDLFDAYSRVAALFETMQQFAKTFAQPASKLKLLKEHLEELKNTDPENSVCRLESYVQDAFNIGKKTNDNLQNKAPALFEQLRGISRSIIQLDQQTKQGLGGGGMGALPSEQNSITNRARGLGAPASGSPEGLAQQLLGAVAGGSNNIKLPGAPQTNQLGFKQ